MAVTVTVTVTVIDALRRFLPPICVITVTP